MAGISSSGISGIALPPGGLAGDVLTKASSQTGDFIWAPGGGTGGGDVLTLSLVGMTIFRLTQSSGASPIDLDLSSLLGVKVTAADTTPDFLNAKIDPGAGLTSSVLNPAANEQLQLNVVANADGSIVVNADDIQVGVLATDAQHGNRGGGALHANFTAALAGFAPASGGGTANFLRADGTWVAPPITVPAGADTQVQFNNAGAFGGSANFTWDDTTLRVYNNVNNVEVMRIAMEASPQIGIAFGTDEPVTEPNYTALRFTNNFAPTDFTDIIYDQPARSVQFASQAGAVFAEFNKDQIALGGGLSPLNASFGVGLTGFGIAGRNVVCLNGAQLFMQEFSSSIGTTPAGYGRFWVRDDTPNVPVFEDDTSVDHVLAYAERDLVAGAGLTGGGDLTANRTFNVGAGTGITVNADDVQLELANSRNVDHTAVTLTAGNGLAGGGDISASRTFDVGAGLGITVNANDVQLDVANTRNVDHSTVVLTAGNGLSGGGDITASRTFDVNVQNSIAIVTDTLQLVNDAASPGNHFYYGTNGAGVKGWQAGPSILQTINLNITTVATTTAFIDQTLTPTSTSGFALASQAITLVNAANRVRVQARIAVDVNNNGRQAEILVHRDGTVLAVAVNYLGGSDWGGYLWVDFFDSPGAGTHTYFVRVGVESSILYINQTALDATPYGGPIWRRASNLTLTEVK